MKAIAWTATLPLAMVLNLAVASSDWPPLLISNPASASQEIGQVAEFKLHKGRLRPQLETILRQHMGVQHIIWLAADAHDWPSDYKLTAANWDGLLTRLIAPYQLRIQLYENHTAVVDYFPHVRGVL